MKEKKARKKNDRISAMRAILLFSIVSAHSSIAITETTGSLSQTLWKIWQVWSIIGVPGFFALSGYLHKGKEEKVSLTFKKKLKGVCIPWVLCGTLIYLITQYPAYNITLFSRFLVGYNSYLYYLTVLMVCYVLFYYLYKNTLFLAICIFGNIISLFLAQNGICIPGLTNFLNPINWIGYFAIGCLLKKYGGFELLEDKRMIRIGAVAMLILLICVGALNDVTTYFYGFSFFIGAVSIVGVYSISCIPSIKNNYVFKKLGDYSFAIYLLHMPAVAMLKRIVRILNVNFYITIPVIVILIFFVVLSLVEKASKKKGLSFLRVILGLR